MENFMEIAAGILILGALGFFLYRKVSGKGSCCSKQQK